MVHDKTGPDRKKLDRRNARQQPIKFKDSGFRTGKMLKKKIKSVIARILADIRLLCIQPSQLALSESLRDKTSR